MGDLAPWAACISALLGSAMPVLQTWPEQKRRVIAVFGDSAGMYDELLDLVDEGVTAPTELSARLDISVSTLCGQLRRLEARGILQHTARGEWQRTNRSTNA